MSALLLSDDLIFTSRIAGTAHDLGVTMRTATTVARLRVLLESGPVSGMLLDLAHPGLVIEDILAWLRQQQGPVPRVVAYGSHVDVATLKRAREAGCDLVLPRSKFVEELPTQLANWCARR